MLRFVKINLLHWNITKFCCSRVVFSNINIKVPDIKLIFDNDFIEKNLKRYQRVGGEDLFPISGVCGKCNGYGFLDWVTRLRTHEDIDEDVLWGPEKPIQVKNENPIQNILFYKSLHDNSLIIYYVSKFDKSELEYRCEQCNGNGLSDTDALTSTTVEKFLNEFNFQPRVIKTKIEKKKTGFLGFLGSFISKGDKDNDKKIQDITYKQKI